MPRIAPVFGYFVLKFSPVQPIFRTKFCPCLGLFFIFLRGEKCPLQPWSWTGESSPSSFYLPMTPSNLANLIQLGPL